MVRRWLAWSPPAVTIDKRVYSPFSERAIWRVLRERRVDTLVITGAETDVCVLAAVLDAVDHGFRVVLATDAVCSSSDRTHDALMTLYRNRFSEQIETAASEAILDTWPRRSAADAEWSGARKSRTEVLRGNCLRIVPSGQGPETAKTSLNSGQALSPVRVPCAHSTQIAAPGHAVFFTGWFFRRPPATRLPEVVNRRVVMRLSQYFLPLLRENPSEAQIVSHRLMLRAGMIRQSSAGIYSWLPLGLRVLKRVEQIVREEQDRAGAQEILMPTIQPAELWRESGRYDDYGKEMLRIRDRHEREMLYGPTNEEQVTAIVRDGIRSYRDLPKNLYHIQWKFRDEVRPRFGVMRGREFLMKDNYSFDLDAAGGQALL